MPVPRPANMLVAIPNRHGNYEYYLPYEYQQRMAERIYSAQQGNNILNYRDVDNNGDAVDAYLYRVKLANGIISYYYVNPARPNDKNYFIDVDRIQRLGYTLDYYNTIYGPVYRIYYGGQQILKWNPV